MVTKHHQNGHRSINSLFYIKGGPEVETEKQLTTSQQQQVILRADQCDDPQTDRTVSAHAQCPIASSSRLDAAAAHAADDDDDLHCVDSSPEKVQSDDDGNKEIPHEPMPSNDTGTDHHRGPPVIAMSPQIGQEEVTTQVSAEDKSQSGDEPSAAVSGSCGPLSSSSSCPQSHTQQQTTTSTTASFASSPPSSSQRDPRAPIAIRRRRRRTTLPNNNTGRADVIIYHLPTGPKKKKKKKTAIYLFNMWTNLLFFC